MAFALSYALLSHRTQLYDTHLYRRQKSGKVVELLLYLSDRIFIECNANCHTNLFANLFCTGLRRVQPVVSGALERMNASIGSSHSGRWIHLPLRLIFRSSPLTPLGANCHTNREHTRLFLTNIAMNDT